MSRARMNAILDKTQNDAPDRQLAGRLGGAAAARRRHPQSQPAARARLPHGDLRRLAARRLFLGAQHRKHWPRDGDPRHPRHRADDRDRIGRTRHLRRRRRRPIHRRDCLGRAADRFSARARHPVRAGDRLRHRAGLRQRGIDRNSRWGQRGHRHPRHHGCVPGRCVYHVGRPIDQHLSTRRSAR